MAQTGARYPRAIQEEARRTAERTARALGGLHGAGDRYKIKLRSAGWRLVYEVRDAEILVLVIAVGRRDRNAVYRAAETR